MCCCGQLWAQRPLHVAVPYPANCSVQHAAQLCRAQSLAFGLQDRGVTGTTWASTGEVAEALLISHLMAIAGKRRHRVHCPGA